ncbi:MAG: twin-arginine translocase TatA/TatE family subunit [Planctomycetota bacterium]
MTRIEPAFLSMGLGEMLVVAVVALLVFGGRLPEVMRNLGRSYAKFRQGMDDLTHPIRQEMRRLDVLSPPAAVPQPRRPASLPAPGERQTKSAEGTIPTMPRPKDAPHPETTPNVNPEAEPDSGPATAERPVSPAPRPPSPTDLGANDEPPPV